MEEKNNICFENLSKNYGDFTALHKISFEIPKNAVTHRSKRFRQNHSDQMSARSFHLLSLIENLCDYFVMIDHGKLIGVGSIEEILARETDCKNLEDLYLYPAQNNEDKGFTAVLFLFTLLHKKTPFECHPADLIHFSGEKFRKILKYNLCKKVAYRFILSLFVAFLLTGFRLNLEALKIHCFLWNLLIFSLAIRQIRYHHGKSRRSCLLLFTHYLFLNGSLYLPGYSSIFVLLIITSISFYALSSLPKLTLDFHKLFVELSYTNKVNYLSRGNNLSDAQEFAREISAQRHRKSFLVGTIRCRHPLIHKNLLTFSRINLFVPIYISFILAIVILLYQLEIFEFVKTLKKSGFALQIIALHQALVINNIIEIVTNQKNLLLSKSREGLYLPYSEQEIAHSFFVLGFPMILIEVLIVGLIFKRSVLIIAAACFLYAFIFYLYLRFEKKKKEDLVRFAAYFTIFIISSYFLY